MKDIVRIGVAVLLAVVMCLSISYTLYADDPPDDEDSGTVIDIRIDGDVGIDIRASGPTELNVETRGPSEVDINTDDQVNLNVEAIEPSEVTVDGKKLVPIVAGTIPALGFLSFFFVRRNQRG